MNVYEYLKLAANTELADRFNLNLFERTLMLDAVPIVQLGTLILASAPLPEGDALPLDGLIEFEGDPYAEIERLYAQYKRSVSGKRERLNKGCFKAVSSDSLTMEELESNMPRQEARLLLEGFVLLATAAGLIPWRISKHFFWQGTDPDLILYRDWIIGKTKEVPQNG